MRSALLLPALLLAGCDRQSRETIDAVPPPSEEAANRLMNGAEQAATDAQARMDRDEGAARSNATTKTQGESR